MRKSVLLRKIVLLLLSAVLLSGILSSVIYIAVTRRSYVEMRTKELMPIARTISEMLGSAQEQGGFNRGVWVLFDRDNTNFLGASLHIYDQDGLSQMSQPDTPRPPGAARRGQVYRMSEEEDYTLVSSDLKTVLAGAEASAIRQSESGEQYLVVGVPIQSGGAITGAVMFTKSVSELDAAMRGLNRTLIISTFAAFLIMLIPAYLFAKRLVVPIRQMRDVAIAMGKGDFTVRADEGQKGEIGELAASMNHFALESGQLEQTRRDYVANVSHELRTPIASIRAMGETLRDGMAKTQEKRDRFYQNIVRESMRLSRLVDDLLELSRLQAGRVAMQKSHFDLREVFQNILDVYSHVAEDAQVALVVDVDMQAPIGAYSNPDRVEQALVILMDNAVKHSHTGGRIDIGLCINDGHLEISVENTGDDIPPEDLPYIFDRFYTVDKSHSGGGTGLGLSIASEVMKGLGERIWAQSGQGHTRFTFTVAQAG
ncbi:MAG: cell wall metabolism sensor histidine kinase WalK [Lachnospiraceae bacterium]|jgi:signal transduction histidine kinase|nr:cell wall metabolism sensor histidine kinase WalK [Lachnospiraceae bacterium]